MQIIKNTIAQFKLTAGLVVAGVIGLLLQTSCDTEYVDAPYPYSEITSFSIDADSLQLQAAITDGFITVYWLYTMDQPKTIAPEISISENASISPASGEAVAFEDGVVYTVTAQDGSTTEYLLDVVVNQPVISINFDSEQREIYLNRRVSFSATNLILDSVSNHVYFIDRSTNESIQMVHSAITDTNYDGLGELFYVSLPEEETTLDTGYYYVKIESGVRSVTSEGLVRVKYPLATFDDITSTIEVGAGGQFTLTGANFRTGAGNPAPLLNAITYTSYSGAKEEITLTYVSHTTTSVTYQLPADIAAGDYYKIQVGLYNDETHDVSSKTLDLLQNADRSPILTVK